MSSNSQSAFLSSSFTSVTLAIKLNSLPLSLSYLALSSTYEGGIRVYKGEVQLCDREAEIVKICEALKDFQVFVNAGLSSGVHVLPSNAQLMSDAQVMAKLSLEKINTDSFFSIEPIDIKDLVSFKREEIRRKEGFALDLPFLLIDLRGGCSIYLKDKETTSLISSQPLGETFLKSSLLRIYKNQAPLDPRAIIEKAWIEGDSREIDLSVGDIYGEKVDFMLAPSVIASSLAKADESSRPEDFLKAAMNLVSINTGIITSKLVLNNQVQNILVLRDLLVSDESCLTISSIAYRFLMTSETCFDLRMNFFRNIDEFAIWALNSL